MAHIDNILRDKLFVFSGSTQTTDAEHEILTLIAAKENLGEVLRTSLIDNEENYDSYKLETLENEFLVKVSLDDSYEGFEREFQILQQLEGLSFAPKPIAKDKLSYGDKISYLVTQFESAQSAEELGKSILFANHEECLKQIKTIHQQKITTLSLQEKLQKIFAATNIENQPEFSELVKSQSDNYQLLQDEILALKQFIQQSYKDSFSSETLCHGNINPSTLLIGPQKISLINWQNSFNAHPFIDLSNLRMEFDFGEDFEFQLFNSYGGGHSWNEYLAIRNFWASIKLLEYVFSYIKEIYLFRSLRQDKILKIFSSFCRNIKFFNHIPAFHKNREELLSLFSSPMI